MEWCQDAAAAAALRGGHPRRDHRAGGGCRLVWSDDGRHHGGVSVDPPYQNHDNQNICYQHSVVFIQWLFRMKFAEA